MKHYVLNRAGQWGGASFTDLFVLGVGRAAAGASDFTDADTAQTITLMTPVAGDIITYPLVQAYTKIGFAGGALSAIALDVGYSGGSEFLLNGAMYAASAAAASPLVSGSGGPKVFDGATTLTAQLDTTGANLADITAGEIWIYVALCRVTDFLTNRTA
jgi:hypothetical protein